MDKNVQSSSLRFVYMYTVNVYSILQLFKGQRDLDSASNPLLFQKHNI
jgi:hypothetical protein